MMVGFMQCAFFQTIAGAIPAEITCALIAAVGVVISALISRGIAKITAAKEVEKMKLSWEREDIISSEEEFGEMASSVSKYVGNCNGTNRQEALAKVAAIRAKENGDLAVAMDELYQKLLQQEYMTTNEKLTKAIEEKRKAKGNTKARK